ncbi:Aste57867_12644 [Aphanomyces stellatus]|uniref:Aste57867_12644 protein n=1 Tax=Aphanomyces stellatus TaxID=120398 RepID=A0A485KW47_9STRA|nr:hypothetical protein As57867_012598 [Aphanomyces stellatus]VFT89494.1 Aste57867_12644 [Aphanomyces stellatus]
METYLRCAAGWTLVPPVLDHIAACRTSLLDDLISQAVESQPLDDLLRVLKQDASFALTPDQMRNAASGMQFLMRGLELQKLVYPSSPSDKVVEDAWESTLRDVQAALGSIPNRDAIAWSVLKRWKRHVKQRSSSDAVTLLSHTSQLVDLDWKLSVVVASSSGAPSPSVTVRVKWTVARHGGALDTRVMDLTVTQFQTLFDTFQTMDVAMGDGSTKQD